MDAAREQAPDYPAFDDNFYHRPAWRSILDPDSLRTLRRHVLDGGSLDRPPAELADCSRAELFKQAIRLRLPVTDVWQYYELSAIFRYAMVWEEGSLALLHRTLLPNRSIEELTGAAMALEEMTGPQPPRSLSVHGFSEKQDTDAFADIDDEDDFLLARLIRADAAERHVFEHEWETSRWRHFNTPDAAVDALHFLYPKYGGGPMYVIHWHDEQRLLEHARQFGLYSARRLPDTEADRLFDLYRAVGPKYCDLIQVPGRSRRAVLEFFARHGLFVPGRRGDRSDQYPASPAVEEIAQQPRQWETCEDLYLRRHRADTPVSSLARSLCRSPSESVS